jgi:predicted PurR-regulated permease PerM
VNGTSDKNDAPLVRVASALESISTPLRVVAIVAATVLLVVTLGEVMMIVFAAVLVAVLLRGAAARVGRLVSIGTGWGLLAVVLLLVVFFGGLGTHGATVVHAADGMGTRSAPAIAVRSRSGRRRDRQPG